MFAPLMYCALCEFDTYHHAIGFKFRIAWERFVIERHAVLEAGTTAASNEHAQCVPFQLLFCHESSSAWKPQRGNGHNISLNQRNRCHQRSSLTSVLPELLQDTRAGQIMLHTAYRIIA